MSSHRQPKLSRLTQLSALLTATVLLAAAGLKAHQLATRPVLEQTWLDQRWLLTAGVGYELVLGLLLLSGLWRRPVWFLALATFLFFTVVSLYKAISGEASCGCFGVISVWPWYTVALDAGLVALLLLFFPRASNTGFQPPAQKPSRPRLRFATVAAASLVLGAPAMVAMVAYEPARLSNDGDILGDDQFVLLEPQAWTGLRFPLLKYLAVDNEPGSTENEVAEGNWAIVLYHNDCGRCRKVLGELEKRASTLSSLDGWPENVAMVELPPFADQRLSLHTKGWKYGRLSTERDWFVTTPAVIRLQDGEVVAAADSVSDMKQLIAIASTKAVPAATDAGTASAATTDGTDPSTPTVAGGTSQSVSAAPAAEEKKQKTRVHQTVSVDWDDGKAEFDFGFSRPESRHKVNIVLTRKDQPLPALGPIRSECKCMTGKEIRSAAEDPRQSLTLELVFEAPNEPLFYSKRLLISSAQNPSEKFVLTVKSRVGMPLSVEPEQVDAGVLIVGQKCRLNVVCVNEGDEEIRPVYGISSDPACTALVPRSPIARDGGRLSVPIVIDASRARAGSTKARISISTTSKLQPTINAAVSYSVTDRFTISQGEVALGSVAAGSRTSHSILIGARDSQERIVERHELLAFQNLEAILTLDEQPGKALLKVVCLAGNSQGPMSGTIRLHLQGHSQPVDLYISGKVKEAGAVSAAAAPQ